MTRRRERWAATRRSLAATLDAVRKEPASVGALAMLLFAATVGGALALLWPWFPTVFLVAAIAADRWRARL